jgi:hypothetical protein
MTVRNRNAAPPSLSAQQSGVVKYAFDRIITEIEENEK